MDERSEIACCDCGSVVPIMFFLANSKGGLVGFCKCFFCSVRGANPSIHVKVKIPSRVWESAVLNDLPVCSIGGE